MCVSHFFYFYSSYFLFFTYNSCLRYQYVRFFHIYLLLVDDLTIFYFSKNLQVCIPAYLHYCNILLTGITPVIITFVLSPLSHTHLRCVCVPLLLFLFLLFPLYLLSISFSNVFSLFFTSLPLSPLYLLSFFFSNVFSLSSLLFPLFQYFPVRSTNVAPPSNLPVNLHFFSPLQCDNL